MPFFGMYEPKGRAWTLQEKLDHLAVLYPQTASGPVRFLSGGAEPCNRETLPS